MPKKTKDDLAKESLPCKKGAKSYALKYAKSKGLFLWEVVDEMVVAHTISKGKK